MSDLIEKLRGHRRHPDNPNRNIFHEAADRIEELERDHAEAQHKIGEYVDKTAELEAENERLNGRIDTLELVKGKHERLFADKLERLQAEVERLREVKKYARHDNDCTCMADRTAYGPCSCGLRNVLETLFDLEERVRRQQEDSDA
jgi:DNA repair exonuclease SbcCD ATPase subunit